MVTYLINASPHSSMHEENQAMADNRQSTQPITSPSSGNGTTADRHNSDTRDFQDIILEIAKKIPQEELDNIPSDFSENFDHYLYGVQKKTE